MADGMDTVLLLVTAGVALGLLAVPLVASGRPRGRTGGPHKPYGRVKTCFLFSSGVKLDLLRQCPTEESNYVGLGSAVVVTATVATASSVAALAVALDARGAEWLRLVPVGIAYGLIIYLIDRFLVSAQLNPYRFDPPPVDGTQPAAPRHRSEAARTVLAALPRLAFALVIGFLIAEPLLLVLFNDEIETEVAEMRVELGDAAAERVRTARQPELDALVPQLPDADADGVSDLDEQTAALAGLDGQIADLRERLDAERVLLDNEIAGAVVGIGGRQSTGLAGCGDRCRQLGANIALLTDQIAELEPQAAQLRPEVDRLRAEADAAERALIGRRQETKDRIAAQAEDERRRAEDTAGLLIRVSALERLATDDTPFAASEGPGASSPGRNIAGLLGLTTLGTVVWTVRLWIVLLDTMPVLFKLVLSLRRRRPYDALVAAQEEAVIARAAEDVRRLRTSRLR